MYPVFKGPYRHATYESYSAMQEQRERNACTFSSLKIITFLGEKQPDFFFGKHGTKRRGRDSFLRRAIETTTGCFYILLLHAACCMLHTSLFLPEVNGLAGGGGREQAKQNIVQKATFSWQKYIFC